MVVLVRAAIVFGLALLVVACSGESDPGPDAAVETFCPPADHPRVHYVGMTGNECVDVELVCTTDQTAFNNTCGCGCVDKGDPICPDLFDPAILWVSDDPAVCGDQTPQCALGDTPFNNSCGCGCITH